MNLKNGEKNTIVILIVYGGNKHCTMDIKKAIKELIRADAREEACEILQKATAAELAEFESYYKKDQGNVCCLILDKIKDRLVEEHQMEQGIEDNFGEYLKGFI